VSLRGEGEDRVRPGMQAPPAHFRFHRRNRLISVAAWRVWRGRNTVLGKFIAGLDTLDPGASQRIDPRDGYTNGKAVIEYGRTFRGGARMVVGVSYETRGQKFGGGNLRLHVPLTFPEPN